MGVVMLKFVQDNWYINTTQKVVILKIKATSDYFENVADSLLIW